MPRAICLIKPDPHYRRDAFEAGLRAAGYELVSPKMIDLIGKDDALCVWNMHGANEGFAKRLRAKGGITFVAENGYYGKDANGLQLFSLAKEGHNGSGNWPYRDAEFVPLDRMAPQGLYPYYPWRDFTTGHILVCGQRGIGSRTMASPHGWEDDVAKRLRKYTKRPIKIRRHPGRQKPATSLAHDMKGAWAVVIWSSASGVQALVEGYPVFFEAPFWVGSPAAQKGIELIEHYRGTTRDNALARVSWAQWSLADIASGEAFRRVREC